MADTPTPDKPGTYLPIPGQKTPTPDEANAAQIAARNTSASETASTSNDIVVNPLGNDGKLFVGGKPKVNEVVVPAISTNIPVPVAGDPGPKGPAGDVDYDKVRAIVQGLLDEMLNFKSMRFADGTPTSVFGGKSISMQVVIVDTMANTSTPIVPTFTITPSSAATITSNGVLTGSTVGSDVSVAVVANYTDSKNKNYTATANVLVKALKPTSLSVSGPTTLTSGATVAYAATVYYTDSSSKVVTLDGQTTWALTNPSIGTLTGNSLKVAASTTTDITGIISATFVEGGTTVRGQATVGLKAPVVEAAKTYAVYGVASAPVTGASYYTYNDWATFITQNLLQKGTTANSKANTITTNQITAQYGWYAYPTSYGEATFVDTSNNFPGGWDGAKRGFSTDKDLGPIVVSFTTGGKTENYYLYRTTNAAIGQKTWAIS